eukprot:SAG11_NODE_36555_length_261_cov_0.617284_1_plen_63_part_10
MLPYDQACVQDCDPGFFLSGDQPRCMGGLLVASVICTPRPCTGVVPPVNGNFGDCATDSSLPH